jgi:hypothetical protein
MSASIYLAETERLGVRDDGAVVRKGQETTRRITEPRVLGVIDDPATSYRVSAPLSAEFERLRDEWESELRYSRDCRVEAEATYAASRGL